MAVKAVPDGYSTVTPFVAVTDAAKFLDFAKQAFGAEEVMRMQSPDGAVGHAEINIGNSRMMVERGQAATSQSTFYLYVNDCDALYKWAAQAGAKPEQEPSSRPWGDRVGMVRDPFGNTWWIATHKEDISPEELARRIAAAMKR